jgi:predicted nucleic acid-binding protein
MTDQVIDASALIRRVMSTDGADDRKQLAATIWHAPHLIDAESGHVLRRAVRRGSLSADQGQATLHTAAAMVDLRYGHGPLSDLAWALRDQLSYYDALYVALAVRLDVPLVTCDRRLANAPGLPCRVELVD